MFSWPSEMLHWEKGYGQNQKPRENSRASCVKLLFVFDSYSNGGLSETKVHSVWFTQSTAVSLIFKSSAAIWSFRIVRAYSIFAFIDTQTVKSFIIHHLLVKALETVHLTIRVRSANSSYSSMPVAKIGIWEWPTNLFQSENFFFLDSRMVYYV